MADWSPARILAPLALLSALVGIVVVIELSGSRPSASERPGAGTATTTTQRARSTKPRSRFYVVKPGDNLTVIATKTGVSIDTIERLNPSVDPQALHAGERLRVAR